MTYMAYAPEWWYVLDPNNSPLFTHLVLLLDVPIMPILFFLAGYFALPSLQKRGTSSFSKDKFIRIGMPWIFGALILAPLIHLHDLFFTRRSDEFSGILAHRFLEQHLYQQSVYWYLGILLLMFVVLVWVYEASERLHVQQRIARPTVRVFAIFITLVTVGFLIISLSFGPDAWWHNYFLVYQPARVPLYVGYFVLGIYADRHGWFTTDGYKPELGPWGWSCVLSGLAYLAYRWGVANTPETTLPVKVGTALLFNTFCFTALIAGVALFQQKMNSANAAWSSLAANSYGIYYVHPLILYPLGLCVCRLLAPADRQGANVDRARAPLASWAVSVLLLKRLPGVRAMF